MEGIVDYEIIRQLGRGSYAKVVLAKRKATQRLYAIKQIEFKNASLKQKENALNEARLLSMIDNPYIIQYKNCFYEERDQILNIVIQYAEKGDLAKKIEKHKTNHILIPEPEVWKMIYQMTRALKMLHSNSIIHRDLKSANIFETASGDFRLADLNVSKSLSVDGLAKTQIGTPFYAAPEIWESEPYNQKCDIWSLGIIAYELAALQLPFPATNVQGLYMKIRSGKFERLPLAYSDELNQIISKMLIQDPKKRATTDTILAACILNSRSHNKSNISNKAQRVSSLLKTIVMPDDERDLNALLPPSQYQQPKSVNTPMLSNKSHVVSGSSGIMRDRTNSNVDSGDYQPQQPTQRLRYSTKRQKALSMRQNNISNNSSSIVGLSNRVEHRRSRLPSVRKIFPC